MPAVTVTADDPRSPAVWEWRTLLLVVVVALGLRGAFPSHMAVDHFDEGVYASNWFCNHPPLTETHEYPQRHLYAPPLWPALLEWVLILSNSNPHSVMWVNVVIGVLSCVLLWWVCRDWFGPVAGLVAAGLLAVNDSHIFFSRTALTDVPLLFLLVAAVWTGMRAIETGRPLWIGGAGLLTALAWWTKYNGWLALAITGSGTAGWLLFRRPQGLRPITFLFRWTLTALIACGLWLPVLWDLEPVGGYRVVAENHAGYFLGIGGWWKSAIQQVMKHSLVRSTEGVTGCLTVMAIGVTLLLRSKRNIITPGDSTSSSRFDWQSITVGVLLAIAIALSMTTLGTTLHLFVLALVGCGVGAFRQVAETGRGVSRETISHENRVVWGAWIVSAWVIGLTLSTPLYTPYPRLLLPWIAATILGTSLLVSQVPRLVESFPRQVGRSVGRKWIAASAVVGVSGLLLLVGSGFGRWNAATWRVGEELSWRNRSAVVQSAIEVERIAREDSIAHPGPRINSRGQRLDAAIYVLGDPPLFYHLSALKKQSNFQYWVQPISTLDLLTSGEVRGQQVMTYLVVKRPDSSIERAIDDAVASGQLKAIDGTDQTGPSVATLLDYDIPDEDIQVFRSYHYMVYRLRS
ncbi:MAG: glycosyltransferase family 39 protein [Planctomycetaceae bacterium]